MRILLLQVDKTHDSYIAEGFSNYSSRLINYTRFEVVTINMPKSLRQKSVQEQKSGEAKVLAGHLVPEDHVILLDETGDLLTSQGFAQLIAKRQNASVKRLVFIIGGPFGFDESIYKRAHAKLSLSRMTFSHQMVRLFFVEQLYRAFTILKGEKYHHG